MDGFLATLYRLVVADATEDGLRRRRWCWWRSAATGAASSTRSSDLDLMVIYDGEHGAVSCSGLTQGLLYTLWDLGLQVGHSLRSLPDCVAMARTDFASRTSMQEARFLVGDRRLFNHFRRVLSENVYRKDFAQFLETTLAERDQRYRKFGGSPYIGEPNVKESAGGLRDIHTAMWLGATKFGARTLRELADKRLITAREQAPGRRGAHVPLARAQRAALPLRPQERRAGRATSSRRSRKNFGYEDDDDGARRREVHARLLPARARDPPRVAPAHRAVPGDAVAPRPGAAARCARRRSPTGSSFSTASSTSRSPTAARSARTRRG